MVIRMGRGSSVSDSCYSATLAEPKTMHVHKWLNVHIPVYSTSLDLGQENISNVKDSLDR